jgi:hypothetical protein
MHDQLIAFLLLLMAIHAGACCQKREQPNLRGLGSTDGFAVGLTEHKKSSQELLEVLPRADKRECIP